MVRTTNGLFILMVMMILTGCSEQATKTGSHAATMVLPSAEPTATRTPRVVASATSTIPRPTLTPSATPTELPLLMGEFTPQAQQHAQILAELLNTDDFTDVIVRVKRETTRYEVRLSSIEEMSYVRNVYLEDVRDLDLDGESEVLLSLITAGAYCCTTVVVFYFDPVKQEYRFSSWLMRKWTLAPDMVDVEGDGKPEFMTRNTDIGWHPTPLQAMSPLQFYQYRAGRIVDVSAEYPHLIEQDAKLWLGVVRGEAATLDQDYLELTRQDPNYWTYEAANDEEKRKYLGRYALITYLYEMDTLGRFDEAWAVVDSFCEDEECQSFLRGVREVILQE